MPMPGFSQETLVDRHHTSQPIVRPKPQNLTTPHTTHHKTANNPHKPHHYHHSHKRRNRTTPDSVLPYDINRDSSILHMGSNPSNPVGPEPHLYHIQSPFYKVSIMISYPTPTHAHLTPPNLSTVPYRTRPLTGTSHLPLLVLRQSAYRVTPHEAYRCFFPMSDKLKLK